jgi:hypothetical protein
VPPSMCISLSVTPSPAHIIEGFHRLDGRGSNPGRGKIFLFSTTSRPALRPTQPPIQWVPRPICAEVKRPGREADHSPPSNGEVKNGGATPPLPHTSSWHSYLFILPLDLVCGFAIVSSAARLPVVHLIQRLHQPGF